MCVAFAVVMAASSFSFALALENNPDFTLIDSFVQSQMKDCRIPGFSLGIIRGTDVLYLKGYGKADETGRAVTPQTPFVVGSVSKTFTALSVMQLVEAGKIVLDEPVQTYLPAFSLADGSIAAGITVRQLLNHTSGIAKEAEYQVAALWGENETISSLVGKFGVIRPVSKSGSRFEYSNANYIILGELIQQMSGMTYGEYIQKHIFEPLEMYHSYTLAEEASQNDLAVGYRSVFGFPVPSRLPIRQDFMPAASIISCSFDMTHFMIAMLNGGMYKDAQVLSEQGILLMKTACVEISQWESYGLGLYVTSGSVFHGGELSDYQALYKLLPQDQLGVVLMYNTSSSTLGTLMNVGYRNRIETGIFNVLYGADPMDQPGRSPLDLNSYPTALAYGVLQFVVVLVVLLLALSLLRLRTLYKRLGKSKAAHLRITLHTALMHFILPFVLLLGIPAATKVSWAVTLNYIPDIGWFVLGFSVLLLLTGVAKGMMIFKYSRQTAHK